MVSGKFLSLNNDKEQLFLYSWNFRFLTQRGSVRQSEAKIVLLDMYPHEDGERISNSTLTDIENRLLEAALMPIKTPAKLLVLKIETFFLL